MFVSSVSITSPYSCNPETAVSWSNCYKTDYNHHHLSIPMDKPTSLYQPDFHQHVWGPPKASRTMAEVRFSRHGKSWAGAILQFLMVHIQPRLSNSAKSASFGRIYLSITLFWNPLGNTCETRTKPPLKDQLINAPACSGSSRCLNTKSKLLQS